MTSEPRPTLARIGIVLLNLIAPGAGLVRLGRWRAGLGLLLLIFVALGLRLIVYAFGPPLGFRAFAALLILMLVALLVSLVLSMALSWRYSRLRSGGSAAWWSRWYALAALLLLSMAAANRLGAAADAEYKTYYIPSKSMMPTLVENDRLVVRKGIPADLCRGDVIAFQTPVGDYVHRVAALAGDRIAMRGGVVLLNGRPVAQREVGRATVEAWDGEPGEAVQLAERFPGEAQDHRIYDLGSTPQDDMPEQTVAPGHVFVLGDNRDMAADSRIDHDLEGVEQLPISRIRGRALFILWSGDRRKIGAALSMEAKP